jgi:hypothetical protein
MKRFRWIFLSLIGVALFLAACTFPGSPTRDPASLQILTPFIAEPIDFQAETLNSPLIQNPEGYSKWDPGQCNDTLEACNILLREWCVSYLTYACIEKGEPCDEWVEMVCRYASDSYPWHTPTPVACDFDCDCEPKQGENEFNCPKDCPKHCGNGTCDCGETSQNCKKDCGPGDKLDCVCGNGVCQAECGETPNTCLSDC